MPVQGIAASLERLGVDEREAEPEIPAITLPVIGAELVKRAQRALRELNQYDGPISGEVDAVTERAIRDYQRRKGWKQTGIVDEKLVTQLEMAINVGQLLDQLAVARKDRMDSARNALLNHPATRDLITESLQDETADAARDASACFANPTVRCLLDEALESAKAVPRSDMRNWAYGELLVAQARAGLGSQARDTARRISDPRLIIAALGQIAEAQALSGRDSEALAAAEIIPDIGERVAAYATIAEISTREGRILGATEAVAHLRENAPTLESRAQRIAYLSQSAAILHTLGYNRDAKVLLADLESNAEQLEDTAKRDSALRHIARSHAMIGDVEYAMAIAGRITTEGERTPVTISASTIQLRRGEIDAARETAKSIETVRFRAVAMASVARELAMVGRAHEALAILESISEEIKTIRYPFARDYATSRVALAFTDIGVSRTPPDAGALLMATDAVNEIQDERLRAETAWLITFIRSDAGAEPLEPAKQQAIEHVEAIRSMPTQAWLLAELAENRARAGHDDWAWELFNLSLTKSEKVKNSWGRARTLSRLAQSLIHIAEKATESVNETTE